MADCEPIEPAEVHAPYLDHIAGAPVTATMIADARPEQLSLFLPMLRPSAFTPSLPP